MSVNQASPMPSSEAKETATKQTLVKPSKDSTVKSETPAPKALLVSAKEVPVLPCVRHFSSFKEGTALKRVAFVEAFKGQYAPDAVALSSEIGLQFAYARFHEVSGVPGGPVFSDQVLMFSNEIDVPRTRRPFFIQHS